MRAEALLALLRACQVRHAGLVRDEALVLDELVRARVVAPVAGTSLVGAAIEDELDAEVDVEALAAPRDLDPVREAGDGPVRPAAATVVRDVLVELLGQVALAIDVVPREVIGDRRQGEVPAARGERT